MIPTPTHCCAENDLGPTCEVIDGQRGEKVLNLRMYLKTITLRAVQFMTLRFW